MAEATCILKDVPTSDWSQSAAVTKSFSNYPIRPSPTSQNYPLRAKRKTLNHLSDRLLASGLAGADPAVDYLYGKYIKNLSVHTIRQGGREDEPYRFSDALQKVLSATFQKKTTANRANRQLKRRVPGAC